MKKIILISSAISLFLMAPSYSYATAFENSSDNQEINNQEIIYLENLDYDNAVQPMSTVPLYFIPGIGQVALFATGVVVIGGITYGASSWLAKAVKSFLQAQTADEIISKNKKASIRKEFPSEYLDKTLNEIEKDAKAGKARAKKAKKLLTDKRFDK